MSGWHRIVSRWWFWYCAAICFLVVMSFAVHVAAALAWNREIHAARTAGYATSVADLIKAAPAVDDLRQERLKRWAKRVNGAPWAQFVHWIEPQLLEHPTRKIVTSGANSATYTPLSKAEIIQCDSDLADLGKLLDGGPLEWGVIGYVGREYPHADAATCCDRRSFQMINYLSVQITAVAFAVAAEGGDMNSLRWLDELLHTTDRACIPWDGYVRSSVERIRDVVYLHGIIYRSLTSQQIADWLAEPSMEPQIAADCLKGERITALMGIAQGVIPTCTLGQQMLGGWTPVPKCAVVIDALVLPQLCAMWSKRLRSAESAFSHGTTLPDIDRWLDGNWIERNSIMEPEARSLSLLLRAYVKEMHWHRMSRALGKLVLAWQMGCLPSDEPAALACMGSLATSTSLLPTLRYERLPANRIRLSIDPNGPLPAFQSRAHLDAPDEPIVEYMATGLSTRNEFGFGQAASRKSYVQGPWWLELDCAVVPCGSLPARPASE